MSTSAHLSFPRHDMRQFLHQFKLSAIKHKNTLFNYHYPRHFQYQYNSRFRHPFRHRQILEETDLRWLKRQNLQTTSKPRSFTWPLLVILNCKTWDIIVCLPFLHSIAFVGRCLYLRYSLTQPFQFHSPTFEVDYVEDFYGDKVICKSRNPFLPEAIEYFQQ